MLYAVALVLCVVLRWVPHPYNLTPLGASAVFAGRTLPLRWAIPLTWLGMLVANVLLARTRGYPFWDASMAFVFGGFALQAALGRLWRKTQRGAFAAALVGGIGFYLVSNLGVWATTDLYPRTLGGLGACFVAALPFLKTTLAGDLLWTLALTPLSRWAQARAAKQPAPWANAAAV